MIFDNKYIKMIKVTYCLVCVKRLKNKKGISPKQSLYTLEDLEQRIFYLFTKKTLQKVGT